MNNSNFTNNSLSNYSSSSECTHISGTESDTSSINYTLSDTHSLLSEEILDIKSVKVSLKKLKSNIRN